MARRSICKSASKFTSVILRHLQSCHLAGCITERLRDFVHFFQLDFDNLHPLFADLHDKAFRTPRIFRSISTTCRLVIRRESCSFFSWTTHTPEIRCPSSDTLCVECITAHSTHLQTLCIFVVPSVQFQQLNVWREGMKFLHVTR